ncbi:MAG: flagellar hook-basal body complex protein [Candidatus Eisenbacteria bacterium]|nr:flagellar hook-basal body complex protein [Candidatus Latescibacterota bacterium]MBD3302271.1 flagellar hook-basal body complex protein [Candidatus Eisenbacteria bacterium]
MQRAMNAGISGLRSHQTLMDVIGNNIANSSTVGFKASRMTFREALALQLGHRAQPGGADALAGPVQVGTGTGVGGIDRLFTQGGIEATGGPFDLALSGEGLFIVRDGERMLYTRAGDFQLDAAGRLVLTGTDRVLQGIAGEPAGEEASGALSDLAVPLDRRIPPQATGTITLAGNLDADAAEGEERTVGTTVHDAAGTTHYVELSFTSQGDGSWSWTARLDGSSVEDAPVGTIRFDETGNLIEMIAPDGGTTLTLQTDDGTSLSLSVDAGTAGETGGVTAFGGRTTLSVSGQDGSAAGELVNATIDSTGRLVGVYSNGSVEVLGRVAVASFRNAGGLADAGGGGYVPTAGSGEPTVAFAGAERGRIVSGALEGSNVDISRELTNMILAQRGFQASARVIMTADEMLREASDLSR